MDRRSRIDLIVIAGALGILAAIAIPNLYEAQQRSKQKRTMADMREAATRFENGEPFRTMRDAWGHPMRIRVRGKHYSIRAAMRDGRFEPEGRIQHLRMTTTFDDDVLFLGGNFVQMPEGI